VLASELEQEIRFELNDMNGTVYSAYDMYNAITAVNRVVGNALTTISAKEVQKNATLSLTASGTIYTCALPSDYAGMVWVKDPNGNILDPLESDDEIDSYTYDILSSSIYANFSSLSIRYKYSFATITAGNDTLPLPPYFTELLKKWIKIYLKAADRSEALVFPEIKDDVIGVAANNVSRQKMRLPWVV
jgi:hypothetical protein